MKAKHLREFVIRPVLESMDSQIRYSRVAEDLLVATACAESWCGHAIRQELESGGWGPAEGIFQMEPATERDIWDSWLTYREGIAQLCPPADAGLYAPNYSAFMCRIHYARKKEPLPALDLDVDAYLLSLAHYWKKHYNTHLGAGDVIEFVEKCLKYGDFE